MGLIVPRLRNPYPAALENEFLPVKGVRVCFQYIELGTIELGRLVKIHTLIGRLIPSFGLDVGLGDLWNGTFANCLDDYGCFMWIAPYHSFTLLMVGSPLL